MHEQPSIQQMLAELTWEDLVSDGMITSEEIDAALKARGHDPEDLMYLYE